MQLLCEIEDVFEITGRGCIIVPGIPHSFGVSVGIGARILVRAPSGEQLETSIAGVEMINRGRPMDHAPFSVPRSIRKAQLPIGSHIFYLDAPQEQ